MSVNHGPDGYRGWFEPSRLLSREERKRKAAYAAFFDSPLLLEQRERKEGCPDERQQSMDGVVFLRTQHRLSKKVLLITQYN
jgi:hypothetical protein